MADDAKRQASEIGAWSNIIDRITAQAAYVVTSDHAVEIALTDGGSVAFLANADGVLWAGLLTGHADPELKKWLGAELENLGLPLFFIPADQVAAALAELTRLLEKKKQESGPELTADPACAKPGRLKTTGDQRNEKPSDPATGGMTAWRSVVFWNVLLLAMGAALFFIDWGGWIHLHAPNTRVAPFVPGVGELHHTDPLWALRPTRFVPGVGELNQPGAEVRWTMYDEFYVTQRANRWGFLDREPLTPQQAARTCHIAFIGDSFVEAAEVPVADKFHVRLEELAGRDLAHLNITTSAYGRRGTGQINQLPFYDEYARQLRPKLVVLVFVRNDIMDNHKLGAAIYHNWDPDHAPYVFAEKTAGGAIALRPLGPAWRMLSLVEKPWTTQAMRQRVELLAKDMRYQSVLAPYLSGNSDAANLGPAVD